MSLLKNEIKFMLKSKSTILLIIVACIAMTIGINSVNMSNDFDLFYIRRSSSTVSFGSAKFGASICSMLFGLFTVMTLDKDKRKRSKAIVESSQSYYKLVIIRILSIVSCELLVTLLGMVAVMTIQISLFGLFIDISCYLFNYFALFFPSLLISTLLITGLYLLTDSLDISFITLGIIFIKSLTSNNYLFTWVQSNIDIISDFVGIQPVGNTILYNRLLWLLICISIFCLGLLFKRRYELNLLDSFSINMKNKGLILVLVVALLGSGFTYVKEPYTMDLSRSFEVVIDEDIFLASLSPRVIFNNEKGEMKGEVTYGFANKGATHIKFNTNEGLKINSINVNGNEIEYTVKKGNIIEIPIPNEKIIEITISYEGKIKTHKNSVGRGMPGYISKDSIYLLENSNWIFRPLVKNEDSIRISGYYIAPEYLTMVVPGVLTGTETKEKTKKWMFEYESHTADIGAFAGKYNKAQIDFGNMDVEFYYSPRHEKYVKAMRIEEYIKDIMKYYTENIGEYYSEVYPLKIVEVALYKRGGHSSENVITISENMLNRDESMYSIIDDDGTQYIKKDTFIQDISVIAHEMAHQWWGTGVNVVESSPWSSEGLAQYTSYKYIQDEFGDMESQLFLSRWESRVRELKNYYYINNTEMLDKVNEKYRESLEMEKLQSELYYLMPIKLLRGEEAIGEEEFLKRLRSVYRNHLLKDLTYDEFLKEMSLSEEVLKVD